MRAMGRVGLTEIIILLAIAAMLGVPIVIGVRYLVFKGRGKQP